MQSVKITSAESLTWHDLFIGLLFSPLSSGHLLTAQIQYYVAALPFQKAHPLVIAYKSMGLVSREAQDNEESWIVPIARQGG